MRYRGYSARVERDEEEQVLRGRVEGIRDIVTFEAAREEDVERALRANLSPG
ncbi:MAG TPA: hypothetical protein VHG91_01685 [Longimicrobium sp.]|nr:hypothetical protein [Longimicrobium sp.]